ncbi:MAG: isoprenyl transferase [Bacteroidetes bacterium]|nr:isoprenyl transferase [Bacteroidota bacterium]
MAEKSLKDRIDVKKLPAHVAIIMDGNGRWAKKQGFARTLGHERGVDSVRKTVEAAAELGIGYLTLYAFSTENWSRPKYEIDALMRILVKSLHKEMKTLMKNNIRLEAIGDLESLPAGSQKELNKSIEATSGNTGLKLVLALSYSSRWEIIEAVKSIIHEVQDGKLAVDKIDAECFNRFLTTHNIPEPELLIRTSGEYRISNFLLWQIAYAELYFTPVLWPDFSKDDFYAAIVDYQHRERRFGLTSEQINKLEQKMHRR